MKYVKLMIKILKYKYLLLLLLGYAAGRQFTPAGRTGLMVSLKKNKEKFENNNNNSRTAPMAEISLTFPNHIFVEYQGST